MNIDTTPPNPMWEIARGEPHGTHALEVAREWAYDPTKPWCLLLLGKVGRGKSVAAAWLWLHLRDEDIVQAQAPGVYRDRGGVLWLRARVLQRLTWQARAELLRRCASAYGLVVDELGGEDERTSEAIGDVLEERGDKRLRTVATTNLDGAAFLQRYGDRLTSRLRSGGILEPTADAPQGRARWAVHVRGDDLRGRDLSGDDEEPAPTPEPDLPITPARQAAILAEYPQEAAALLQKTRLHTAANDDPDHPETDVSF